MNPLREWAQHNLIRALTAPRNKEISRKILPEIRKKWFVSSRYRKAFVILKKEFSETGKFPSWKSLMSNPSLPPEDSKYLRTKEIKRKNNEKDDVTLRVPVTEQDYSGLTARMRFDSQHVALINMHNKVSSALDDDNLTPEGLEAITRIIQGTTDTVSEFNNTKGEHVSLDRKSAKSYLKKSYKNLQNRFFIPTGFKAFDSVNVGIPSSALFVILGKTGAGKSSLALNICMNGARAGARVCFVPLEMSIDEMLLKVGSRLLMQPLADLMQDFKKSFRKIFRVTDQYLKDIQSQGDACFDFYVPEQGDTVQDVLDFLQPHGYDLVCLDYPKLLSSGNDEEWKALDKGAAYAKRWSARNLTYVMWLAQMDDSTESIRYCKAVLEHASNSWAISGDVEENRESGQVLIKQRKARSQVPMSFPLKADLACSYFGDMDEDASGIGDEGIGDEKYKKKKKKKRKDAEIEDDEVTTTKKNQDKTRVRREKGRVRMQVGPGLDDISSKNDVFLDVPEE